MQRLTQHSNLIHVHADDGVYTETLDDFAQDYGSPMPALPPNITQRIYEPGRRHALSIDNDVVDGGPMPWPEGDAIIAQAVALTQNKQQREQGKWQAHVQSMRDAEANERAEVARTALEQVQARQAEMDQLRHLLDAATTPAAKRQVIKQWHTDHPPPGIQQDPIRGV